MVFTERQMITIKDIAKECGVSASTVSRALSGSELIPDVTKKKIRQVAEKLGYVKNEAASALKTGMPKTLGVINFVDEKLGFSHYLFANVLNGFSLRANELNYDIVLISAKTLYTPETIMPYLNAKNLSGVIILSGHLQSEGMKRILQSDFPTVVFDPRDRAILDMTSCISSDNFKGMFDLTNYVISKGHGKIVYVTGEDYYVTEERINGFKCALKRNGRTFNEDMIVRGNFYNLSGVRDSVDKILSRADRPTCILFSDDYCAVNAYDVLRRRGLVVGKDISLAGFDGIELALHARPKLTTVFQNSNEIGKLAADMLISEINGYSQKTLKLIPATLVKTESVISLK